MSALAYKSPQQLVVCLLRKARMARVIRRRRLTLQHSRAWHDARIRESEQDIKACLWPFGLVAGQEL